MDARSDKTKSEPQEISSFETAKSDERSPEAVAALDESLGFSVDKQENTDAKAGHSEKSAYQVAENLSSSSLRESFLDTTENASQNPSRHKTFSPPQNSFPAHSSVLASPRTYTSTLAVNSPSFSAAVLSPKMAHKLLNSPKLASRLLGEFHQQQQERHLSLVSDAPVSFPDSAEIKSLDALGYPVHSPIIQGPILDAPGIHDMDVALDLDHSENALLSIQSPTRESQGISMQAYEIDFDSAKVETETDPSRSQIMIPIHASPSFNSAQMLTVSEPTKNPRSFNTIIDSMPINEAEKSNIQSSIASPTPEVTRSPIPIKTIKPEPTTAIPLPPRKPPNLSTKVVLETLIAPSSSSSRPASASSSRSVSALSSRNGGAWEHHSANSSMPSLSGSDGDSEGDSGSSSTRKQNKHKSKFGSVQQHKPAATDPKFLDLTPGNADSSSSAVKPSRKSNINESKTPVGPKSSDSSASKSKSSSRKSEEPTRPKQPRFRTITDEDDIESIFRSVPLPESDENDEDYVEGGSGKRKTLSSGSGSGLSSATVKKLGGRTPKSESGRSRTVSEEKVKAEVVKSGDGFTSPVQTTLAEKSIAGGGSSKKLMGTATTVTDPMEVDDPKIITVNEVASDSDAAPPSESDMTSNVAPMKQEESKQESKSTTATEKPIEIQSRPPIPKEDKIHKSRRPMNTVGKLSSRPDVIVVSNKAIPRSAVNNTDRSGRTPLFKVSGAGDVRAVKDLIRAGADVNFKDHAGWSPLHEACLEGQLKICELLIRYGADVNALGFENQTPLHDAVANNHYDVVELLLSHGASLGAVNKDGNTPMDDVEDDTMNQLLQLWKRMTTKVVEVDENGLTILHTYAIKGDLKGVKRVLKYGAEVDFACNAGWTPLHEAASKGFLDIVEELCRYGADLHAKGGNVGVTPLMDAVASGYPEVVKLLLGFGANPKASTSDGKSVEDYVDSTLAGAAEIRSLLNMPESHWTPHKTPDYIKTKPANGAMMDHIRNQASALLIKDTKQKLAKKNSVSSDTSHSTNLAGSLGSKGVVSVSATTAAAVGLGGPNSFSWGGLDPREREGPFVSSREERKFNALLKTLGGGAPSTAQELSNSSSSISNVPIKKSVGRPKKQPVQVEPSMPDKASKNNSDEEDEAERKKSSSKRSGKDRRNDSDESSNEAGKHKRAKTSSTDDEDESESEVEPVAGKKRSHEAAEYDSEVEIKRKKEHDKINSKKKIESNEASKKVETSADRPVSLFDEEEVGLVKKEPIKSSVSSIVVKKEKINAKPQVTPGAHSKHIEARTHLPLAMGIQKKPSTAPNSSLSVPSQSHAPLPSPLKKKPKKKNLFGISGYQRAGDEPPPSHSTSTDDASAPTSTNDWHKSVESLPESITSSKADAKVKTYPTPSQKRLKCLPLYKITLPPLQPTSAQLLLPKKAFQKPSANSSAKMTYFADLQVAFLFGKKSGRELLDEFPSLGVNSRVATLAQKEMLSASPVGEAVLKSILERQRKQKLGLSEDASNDEGSDHDEVLDEQPPRWIKWYERNGKRALRMEDLDIQLLYAEEVLKEASKLKKLDKLLNKEKELEFEDLDIEKFGLGAKAPGSTGNLSMTGSENKASMKPTASFPKMQHYKLNKFK